MTTSIYDILNPGNQPAASIVNNTDTVTLGQSGALAQGTVAQVLGKLSSGPIIPPNYTVSTLPSSGNSNGMLAYASNGLKIGETTGAGTGVVVYYSNNAWRVLSTDAVVSS